MRGEEWKGCMRPIKVSCHLMAVTNRGNGEEGTIQKQKQKKDGWGGKEGESAAGEAAQSFDFRFSMKKRVRERERGERWVARHVQYSNQSTLPPLQTCIPCCISALV